MRKRRSDAGEPVKYMGCGDCENLSRSTTLPMATDDVDVLQRITTQLFGYFQIDAKDIRGMGLQASKLEAVDNNKRGHENHSIRSWLVSSSARKNFSAEDGGKVITGVKGHLCLHTVPPVLTSGRNATLPALHELDMGVVESLPPEVFAEINDVYSGELINLISKKKQENVDTSTTTLMLPQNIEDLLYEDRSAFDPLENILRDEAEEASNDIMVGNSFKSLLKEDEQKIEKQF